MTDKNKVTISKLMSLVLRHNPAKLNINLDENGWSDVDKLMQGINKKGHKVTLVDLKEIVESNDKKRFKFNDDFTKIRANQGHSINVDVELKEAKPPAILYHGTATKFLSSIEKQGLVAGSRLHVHLSSDKETANQVGIRHGKPVVLTINSEKMYADGNLFYLSDNNVWLTNSILPKYIYS